MKVLVTGASGFLGSRITQRLLDQGHGVRVLCRSTSDLSALGAVPVERVTGDLADAASVRVAVQGCEVVIHAAADTNYWRQDPERQMRVNVDGTRSVAQACRELGVRRLVHISSVAAIGIPDAPDRPANEDFLFNLQDTGLVYHLSKWRAEQEVRAAVEHGLDAVIVNPASIMRPRHAAQLTHSVRRASVVPCYSGGNCIVHADDVVSGLLAALEQGRTGERYILGGENLTFRSLSEKAAGLLQLRRKFVCIPPLATGLLAMILEPWARFRLQPPRISYMVHYCANRFQFYDSGRAGRELRYHPRGVDAILREMLPGQETERRAHAG